MTSLRSGLHRHLGRLRCQIPVLNLRSLVFGVVFFPSWPDWHALLIHAMTLAVVSPLFSPLSRWPKRTFSEWLWCWGPESRKAFSLESQTTKNMIGIILIGCWLAFVQGFSSTIEVDSMSVQQREQLRALQDQVAYDRNQQQLNLSSPRWDEEMRRFKLQLVDHHPHRGRRLLPEETSRCLQHFALSEREVRLALLGHILHDHHMIQPNPPSVLQEDVIQPQEVIATSDVDLEHNQHKSIAPFLALMQVWDDTRAPQQVKPMFDWFNGSCNNGALLLLSHTCVHTMLQTEEGSNKVYGKRMSLQMRGCWWCLSVFDLFSFLVSFFLRCVGPIGTCLYQCSIERNEADVIVVVLSSC